MRIQHLAEIYSHPSKNPTNNDSSKLLDTMEEYFIRNPESEEAKGPYTIEQLLSLAEANKIDPETLFYDDEKEVWLAIKGSETLKEKLFPSEKKLILRKKEEPEELPPAEAKKQAESKIAIEDLLAAAEGDTKETKHKAVARKWKDRVSVLTIKTLTLTFFLSAVGLMFINLETVMTLDPMEILKNPFLIFAAIDLLFTLSLALSVTTVYPLIRFRSVIGLGFMSYYFWNFDQPIISALIAVSMLGTFVNTLTLRISVFIFSGTAAIFGMLGFIAMYYLYLNPPVAA